MGSYALTQVGLGLIGDKGLSKASKLGQAGKVTKLAKNKIPQAVSHITSNLQMGDRFAFAGGNSLRFRFDTPDFKKLKKSCRPISLLEVKVILVGVILLMKIIDLHFLIGKLYLIYNIQKNLDQIHSNIS